MIHLGAWDSVAKMEVVLPPLQTVRLVSLLCCRELMIGAMRMQSIHIAGADCCADQVMVLLAGWEDQGRTLIAACAVTHSLISSSAYIAFHHVEGITRNTGVFQTLAKERRAPR